MTARRLIIWRHGRTEWNHTGRFQGQADVALDEVGRSQAAVAAQVLAGYRPDAIVASDLSRARETAGALAELTGLEVRLDKRLREIHVGSWEGLTAEQIAEQDPEFADHWARGIDMRRSSTGETSVEVAERAAEALIEIAAGAPDESTVVVAMHGLSGRVGACHFVGLPEPAWYALAGMVNCGWIVLELSRTGHWRIDGYNLTATLAG
ncbi:MAG: histidine phosphatase family protein [Propionibacteriaceae bacterium]